jgi:hypothetical protein
LATLPEAEREEEDLLGADLAGEELLGEDLEKDGEDFPELRGAATERGAEKDRPVEKLDPEEEEGDLREEEICRLQVEENEGVCGLVSLGRLPPNDDTLREELLDKPGRDMAGFEE